MGISANELFRDFVRWDAAHPLPLGDPSSGVHNPRKRDFRDWANGFESGFNALMAGFQGHYDAWWPALTAAVHAQIDAAIGRVDRTDQTGFWAQSVPGLTADATMTLTPGSPDSVAVGDLVQTRAEGYSYQVVTSGHDITTAGGVKLKQVGPMAKPQTYLVAAPYQRFLSTKLGDVLSAQDFGAKPGVAQDQSAALNSAIGALLDIQASYPADLKQVRHEIDLGPGEFRVENPLTPLAAGGRIRGRGPSVTKLLGYGAFDLISTREFEADGTTRRYYNGMEISDFAVISSDPLNPLTIALKLRGLTRNNAVRGVHVQSAVVAFDVDHSWTLALDHCTHMGSAATLHHVKIGPNTGALVISGGRYDAARDHGVYVPVSSDQIELIIQNDCAVQFGNKAAVRVNGARTVKVLDSFFEGNCIGSSEDYYLDIRGTGSTLSSCEIRGSAINNLAQAARDGLGVAFIDGFQSVYYDTSTRWVRNGARPYPAFGPNIVQADIALASSHTITAADLPFLTPGGNRRATIRQVARPVRVYGGMDMNQGGSFDGTKGSASFGNPAAGQVMLGAHNGRPALQGFGSGSGFDLELNPHDGAVHVPTLVSRTIQTSSSVTVSKAYGRYVVDTADGGRVVTLADFASGTSFEVVKPSAANNLVFSPGATGTINSIVGDKAVTAAGRYTVTRLTGGWLVSHQALA